MKMTGVRRKIFLFAAMLLALGLCGCGKAAVKINDGGVVTELEVSVPRTVEKILEDAEITLDDGDEVSPSLDTKVSEEQEIVISRENHVSVTIGGETKEVAIVGGKVSDLLKQLGITLGEKQHVNYGLDEYLSDGMKVQISETFSIQVKCDGETRTQETEAVTVGDALEEMAITVGKDDKVTPSVEEKVTDGMKIVVKRVTFDTVVEKEAVAYETTRENDSSLEKGREEVSVKGEDGEKEVTYRVTYVDGVEKSRKKKDEKVVKEPVNEVVRVGTKEEAPKPKDSEKTDDSGKKVVSKKAFYDCDGSGHGYYEIKYEDGTVEYEDF